MIGAREGRLLYRERVTGTWRVVVLPEAGAGEGSVRSDGAAGGWRVFPGLRLPAHSWRQAARVLREQAVLAL